ncbi:MAG TPA: L,D-transpeptidase family protein [Streptosporangiaceae bacterium]
MGYGARLWLAGLGTAAAVGASLLGQTGAASAGMTGVRVISGAAADTGRTQAGSGYAPAARTLTLGMHGADVKALQQRLSFLHYYPGKIDGRFGWSTMEAVWAFKEVQYGKIEPPNPDIVGPLMQRQLRHPRLPRALKPHGGAWRVEVNKNIEVLVVYKRAKITLISHVSTAAYYRPDGTGWITPDGRYLAWHYIQGAVADASFGGYMYNPVFFIRYTFAIHGMPNPTSKISWDGVPLNAASHGCVRIPMDVSVIFHNYVHVSPTTGTPIYILGHNN